MGLYWWEFVNDWVVWVGGFLFDGQSVSDGLFHGGGGGNSRGRGGGDGWLKERDSEKEISTDGGEGWERDCISIILWVLLTSAVRH